MPVTSVRIDKKEIEYLNELAEKYKMDRSSLIKKAIKIGIRDILLDDAINRYQKGMCSAWSAASEAKVTLWEFLSELHQRGILFRTDEAELEKALKEFS